MITTIRTTRVAFWDPPSGSNKYGCNFAYTVMFYNCRDVNEARMLREREQGRGQRYEDENENETSETE